MRTRQQIEDLYPLSPVQHGMLFHCLLSPEVGVYFVQKSCTLKGDLDVAALERAWQKVLDRHPVLRTGFVWEGMDEPVQVVYRGVRLPIRQEDWRGLSADEQGARLAEHLRVERRSGFDLTQAPLMRLDLFRLADDAYRLIWSHHHLLMDGWCNTLILREVFTLYEAYARGREVELEPSRPFRDYIAWLQGQDLSRATEFWRETLEGFETPTPLAVEQLTGGRAAEQSFDEEYTLLSLEATRALQATARRHRLTMHTVVQGAWALLLSRYSGERDVLFGDVVAGRPAEIEGIETMVGMFINALPVRVGVTAGERLLPWLKRLQEHQIESRQYEHSPLVQVQQCSDVPQGTPLFDSLLGYQNYPVDATLRDGRASVRIEDVHTIQTANYPVIVTITPVPELMTLIKYDCSRFDVGTVRRMLGHFQTLLEAFAADPERRLEDYDVLTGDERRQLLVDWNDTTTSYPRDRQVQELFEEQAARTPDAAALVFGEQTLTYRELNERANQLARHLRAQGVGAESLVGLCVERSAELIVGMLGILKAGGAYVPLDPSYPVERLSFMMADAAIEALVAQERSLDELPSFWGPVVCLDADADLLEACETENLPPAGDAGDLAYVIYTSGSTGTPKGISIVHRAIARLVRDTDYVTLTPEDRVAQASNSSFDAATFEVWGALLNGACLVGIDKEVALSPGGLAAEVRRRQINTLFLTTALFNQLAASEPGCFAGVRHLLFGGEAVDPRRVRQVLSDGAPERLLHVYGPTECTTYATWQHVERVADGDQTVPIGRPLANTQYYVLDTRLDPVPVGVAGELYLGGPGLARGYLNRPALTAEKFVPNPYSAEAGERLYKTGDRVRLLPGGAVEFLGRVDNQVKVRGHRIELGEVEAVITAHPAVRECAVIVRDDSGDRRLVAYVVAANEDAPPTGEELRRYLGERLPDYMAPSRFVSLPALPLTPNGKVDRRALPAPDAARDDFESAYLAPRTPTEEMLAGVWGQLLGVERVGAGDNFFSLGGHSLLATQVMSRIRDTFGVEIALRELFEQPTLRALADCVDASRQAASPVGEAPPLVRAARTDALPLSFAQQRLWFLEQLEPGGTAYNIPVALRLSGALDADALEASLNDLIRRHETLRTTFRVVGNEPAQVVAPFEPLALPLIDLSALPRERAEAEAVTLRDAEARRGFDLAEGPLLRVGLLRLAEDEHLLLVTMHHIISDGWSMGVLVREVAALYDAHRAGVEADLPELDIQYADYAAWQREYLSGEVLEQQLDYWKKQLAGAPPALELPADRPRPAVQSFRGAALTFSCSPELSDALRSLSRREGATLYMTLLAAFAALLKRHSGEGDVVVGSPIANRNRAETEGLIGFFVNTLAVRTRLGGDPTFAEALRGVRDVVLGAYAHQDVPFERVVEELKPERDLSRSPVFQVMFAWQNASSDELRLEGVRIAYEGARVETAKYDLGLTMWERDGVLEGLVDYSTDLYEGERIEKLTGHFVALLEKIVAGPEGRLSQLAALPEAETRRQLVEWNDTRAEYPRDLCVHELFEARAASEPNATALLCEGVEISFGELNRRANRLARGLRRLGAGPETVVGLCLAQSAELPIAMLAVLKAGAAYLPLDPSYPAERLNYLLADSRAAVLLTERPLAEKFDDGAAQVLCLDALAAELAREPDANVESGVAPDNAAYVIYTSGSTGTPKGVVVPHRGLVNHATAVARRYGLRAADRVLQFAAPAFDVAAEEIFPTWLSGAAVVLWPERHGVSFAEFNRFAESNALTVLNLPTPYWQEWVQSLAGGRQQLPETLRVMVVGSAAGLPERFATWRRLAGQGVRTFNAYGPTEATITSTVHELCDAPAGDELAAVPVGRPVANTRAYLLDAQLTLVPAGAPGELYLGGVQLARGYLSRPALTAERFIPDPFSSEPGARLYRTGDLARYTAAGELEFLGRADDQVKIRGHRIELGEVEAVLAQHAGVRDVVVIAADAGRGEKFLAAYVVAAHEQPTVAELRSHLRARLPEYMMPGSFVFLAALPLTPNGKVDLRALPAADDALAGLISNVAPRTPDEEMLAGLWADVLKLEGVGIRDNFFDLGGHSLLATQVVSRVREMFGVEVALRQLFERPTVEALAEAVAEARAAEAGDPRPRLVRTARDGALPLSYAQQRLWFLDQLEPGSGFNNIPVALRLEGRLDVGALEAAFNEIVRRHESLRTTFASADGEPVQVIREVSELRLVVEDVSRDEAARLAEEESRAGFDLAAGPLLRVRLLRVSEEEHVLLVTMHHIVSDGWSMGVLVREVAALYEARRAGVEARLPELPVQYADFAAWQRAYLGGGVLEKQLSYWKGQLAGAPVIELPADRPRPEEQTHSGAQHPVRLDEGLAEALRSLSRGEGATLYMTMLAAFATLLNHLTGRRDIVVGTDVANRNQVETEGLIGFFVNQLAMRVRVDGDLTFRELLRGVRQIALEAYAHQEAPFDRVVDALGVERSLKYSPLFQVKLVLQNTPSAEAEAPGLRLSNVEIDRGTSQLDLNLRLTEFDGAIYGSAEYSTDLFDRQTIARLLRGFELLLGEVAERPDARVSELVAAVAAAESRQREERGRELKQSISDKLKNRRRATSGRPTEGDATPAEVAAVAE
ncbi:MAG TPA: amino acid adenylation domain-containing protein [Pyrinomonadaceae bacterium]|jgi:amino acid adenylation domain-containing protein